MEGGLFRFYLVEGGGGNKLTPMASLCPRVSLVKVYMPVT